MPSKKRILIVDDEVSCLTLLRAILKKAGYEVLEARSAATALELLEHQIVDLIISDVRMPGMNGIEFLSEVREWDMDLPVLFVSGKGPHREWDAAIRAGGSHLIEKPYKKETLLKAVHRAFAEGAGRSEIQPETNEYLEI